MDRGGDSGGLDVVDYYGHDVVQHVQLVAHHFDVAHAADLVVDAFVDVLIHVALGVITVQPLHEPVVAVVLDCGGADVVHVALCAYVFVVWTLLLYFIVFSTFSRASCLTGD